MSPSNLIPGDPNAVGEIANQFGRVAAEATGRAEELRVTKEAVDPASSTWRGVAARGADLKFDDLVRGLQDLSSSFEEAQRILETYGRDLDEAQVTARRLQQDQGEAESRLEVARAEMREIEGYMREAEANVAEARAQAEADMAADPEAAPEVVAWFDRYSAQVQQSMSEYEQRFTQLEETCAQLEDQITQAERDLETLRNDWNEKAAGHAERLGGVDVGSATQFILH
jgi:chromosome segregation ATPase